VKTLTVDICFSGVDLSLSPLVLMISRRVWTLAAVVRACWTVRACQRANWEPRVPMTISSVPLIVGVNIANWGLIVPFFVGNSRGRANLGASGVYNR